MGTVWEHNVIVVVAVHISYGPPMLATLNHVWGSCCGTAKLWPNMVGMWQARPQQVEAGVAIAIDTRRLRVCCRKS